MDILQRFVSRNFGFVALIIIVLLCPLSTTNASSNVEPQEAYFNGTAYLRLYNPMPIWGHSVISLRSCNGGEILSQRYRYHMLRCEVQSEFVKIELVASNVMTVQVKVPARLLNNKWHTIEFLYQLGNLNLIIDKRSTVIANSTYNVALLTDREIKNDAAVLILGNKFSGCLLHGPGLVFHPDAIRENSNLVQFGRCPLSTGPCPTTTTAMGGGGVGGTNGGNIDLLAREPTIDGCVHDPCMQHGRCVSRDDGYECHCTARYDGKNCEMDKGPPCTLKPCKNDGDCVEDSRGDYTCACKIGFNGRHCENEISVHPLCKDNQCQNNSTCKVNSVQATKYECDCLPGFSGPRCEIDRNECESQPCQNNGLCIDKVGTFLCECTGTGYKGTTCDININECAQSNVCLNNGVCYDNYGSFTCACPPGFGGSQCEQMVNECLSQPCGHGATCIDQTGGRFVCHCADGYSGEFCERGPPCGIDNSCDWDLECVNGTCMCKQDISGRCLHNITQKLAQSNACNCLNGASCSGTSASNFACICPSGFTGTRCETPLALSQNDCGCLNGGTCNQSVCVCPKGFEGNQCEHLEQCNALNCLEPMICNLGKCICPDGNCGTNNPILQPCATMPCLNGGTCHNIGGTQYFCECSSRYNGTNCEEDLHLCSPNPKDLNKCHFGVCINETCFCTPGYTGRFCDAEVDECLSLPCKNGATCKNLVNNYECKCPPGFDGKDCSHDIDECANNPCESGSTCVDKIADFECKCVAGMTGRLCEINIDDCESQPCQHNGRCIDQLDGFLCNCTDTGYAGGYCEININECDSSPCINNATCIDLINDYECKCMLGYLGKMCQIDINECDSSPCQFNGKCYERSNITLYTLPDRFDTLPKIFHQPFSYETAHGYECVCVTGIEGKNCEININECDSEPCANGNCVDGVGSYTCECPIGYEGRLCETDIDECERYQPCVNGKCYDNIGFYTCRCDKLFGGKNCSVALKGCTDQPCLNGGTCTPYLENEDQHYFNCSCPPGYQGVTCEKGTTLSLVKDSLLTLNTTRPEGYDIKLRFRTTLPNGILVFGSGGFYSYILELVNGRLNLHSSLLNKWEGVFIGSTLNDSMWHKVLVSINSTHLLLSANEETTIYPITSYDSSSNGSYTAFPVTFLGGTIPHLTSYLRHLTHAPSSFVGCMQDVVINGEFLFPHEPNAYQSLVNVKSGCERTDQCNPNPCHSNGRCIDQWHTYSCACERPHLGRKCEFNITAATFGHENTTQSTVLVNVNDVARRLLRSVFDISMFIKTRQSTGQVFYLGSDPSGINDTNQSFVSAKLNSGELLVKIQFNGTPEEQPVGGNRLDNGHTHLLQVVRNLTLVQVKINGTEYFRKTLSSIGPLDAEVLYLGGPPPSSQLKFDENNNNINLLVTKNSYFKGIIQDVQVSNGANPMTIELFPLNEPDLEVSKSFGDVHFDNTSILKGEVTDDLCRSQPCLHEASCKNTWNDFECTCTLGYKGKLCQDIKFCELQSCPGQALCQNLENGFECITNMTFQGNEPQPLAFAFYQKDLNNNNNNNLLFGSNVVGSVDVETVTTVASTIEISYRTKTGGTLLYVQNMGKDFEVAVYKDQVTAKWSLSPELPEIRRFHKENSDFGWQSIYFRVTNGALEGGFKGWQDSNDPIPAFSVKIDETEYAELFSGKYMIYLGGKPVNESTLRLKSTDSGLTYKGCLGEARIGGLLLPFFEHNEIYPEPINPRPHFRLNSTHPEEGCILCFDKDCQNAGKCENPSENYACTCPAGYEMDDCSVDIDECLMANCENNATCKDLVANYTCICVAGYDGQHCEHEINECESNPCHNGGNCTDLIGDYLCTCTEDYAGPQCDILRLVTCENTPCRNESTCIDGYNSTTGNNFTCNCRPGLEGALCDTAFCHVKECQNGGFCLTTDQNPMCQCSLGFIGKYCEIDIDECEPKPCKNGGVCIDLVGSYRCRCENTGFEGENCDVDIDECMVEQITCGGRGICLNTPGSYRCNCDTGLCGRNCDLENPCRAQDVCLNGGICIDNCREDSDYICNCTNEYIGKNCTEMASFRDEGFTPTDVAIIVVPIVVGILAIAGIALTVFLMMARNKRATRGTYSPSAQEYCNPRLEMDNVLKPPPEERLI